MHNISDLREEQKLKVHAADLLHMLAQTGLAKSMLCSGGTTCLTLLCLTQVFFKSGEQ